MRPARVTPGGPSFFSGVFIQMLRQLLHLIFDVLHFTFLNSEWNVKHCYYSLIVEKSNDVSRNFVVNFPDLKMALSISAR